MNPEVPSSLDPLAQDTQTPSQPAPIEAPVATSLDTPGVIDATDQSPLKQIRTYQGDIAEAIKSQHASVYSMREAERARADLLKRQEEKNGTPAPAVERTPLSEETKRRIISILLMLAGLALLAGALLAGYLAYERYSQKTAVPVVEIPKNRFLPVVATENLDTSALTRDTLISTLSDTRTEDLQDGNIKHIELTKGSTASSTLMTPTEFMLLLSARAPGSLVRSFDLLFMLGVLGQPTIAEVHTIIATTTATSTASTSSPQIAAAKSKTATSTASTTPSTETVQVSDNQTVLLMKLDSFDNAYAGMLAWEPSLRADLLPLFQSPEVSAGVADDAQWNDLTIKNKDARVLRDSSGKTRLIYSFYNQNLLIITGSEGALKAIMSELDTQALAR